MNDFIMGAIVVAADIVAAEADDARMNDFIMGAIAMAYTLAGLFFLRFWTRTQDRLFLIFASAFWLLGINRVALAVTDSAENHYLYWVRLAAFLLILGAILDKNRPRRRASGGLPANS